MKTANVIDWIERGMVPDEELARLKQWEQFLKLYRTQHWKTARSILDNLREQDPDRYLYTLYDERIARFMEEPPGEDWDGVFTHESK